MPVLPIAPQQRVSLLDYLLELLPPPDQPDQSANTVVQRFVEENHCNTTKYVFVCQAVSNALINPSQVKFKVTYTRISKNYYQLGVSNGTRYLPIFMLGKLPIRLLMIG